MTRKESTIRTVMAGALLVLIMVLTAFSMRRPAPFLPQAAATAAPTAAAAAPVATAAAAAKAESIAAAAGNTVYITPSGKKYHRADCSSVKNSSLTPITPEEAAEKGYTPCKICKPTASGAQ